MYTNNAQWRLLQCRAVVRLSGKWDWLRGEKCSGDHPLDVVRQKRLAEETKNIQGHVLLLT